MKPLKLICSLLVLLTFLAKADTIDSGYRETFALETSLSAIGLNRSLLRIEQENYVAQHFNNWYQSLIRVAVGQHITDNLVLLFGYDYLPTHNLGGNFIGQQNVWPALRYTLPLPFGTLIFRSMLESNFISLDVRERQRQLIRFNYPFEFEPRLSFVVYDEVWYRWNTTKTMGKAGFDQNDGYVGFGWTFNPMIRTDIGYYNQYLDDANHVNVTMRHFMQFSLSLNF